MATIATVVFVLAWILWPHKPTSRELVSAVVSAPVLHIAAALLTVATTSVAHEALHLLAVPRSWNHAATAVGADPRACMLFVSMDLPVSKGEMLRCALAPFLSLTVLPFLYAAVAADAPGWIGLAAIYNASMSTFDLIASAMIVLRVPAGAKAVRVELDGVFVER